MLLDIKPICDRRPRRDGTSLISIQYCFSSDKRTLLPTGLAIPPRYWNKRVMRISSDLPATIGDAAAMNRELQRLIRIAEDIVSYALQQDMEDPLEFVKKVYSTTFDPITLPGKAKQLAIEKENPIASNPDFFFQLDDYIRSKSRKVSPGMLRTYGVVKRRLLSFEKHSKQKISFASLDFNFYEAFVNYLTNDHLHMRRSIYIRG